VVLCWFQETLCLCAQFELVHVMSEQWIRRLMVCVTALLRLWKEVQWFDALHICFELLLLTWMLVGLG
jgi:hypothetical protein